MNWPTHILLVDDHTLFRDGLSLILRQIHPGVAVQHAVGVPQALARLAERPVPELVLLDMAMRDVAGVQAVVRMREALPQAPLVVVSGLEDDTLVWQCIDAGAMGYITKSSDLTETAHALEQVMGDHVYLPAFALATHRARAACTPDPLATLTPRQREVLRHLVRGQPNKLIARELGISEATVKSHVTVVMQVLGVGNRAQVVFTIAKFGLPLG